MHRSRAAVIAFIACPAPLLPNSYPRQLLPQSRYPSSFAAQTSSSLLPFIQPPPPVPARNRRPGNRQVAKGALFCAPILVRGMYLEIGKWYMRQTKLFAGSSYQKETWLRFFSAQYPDSDYDFHPRPFLFPPAPTYRLGFLFPSIPRLSPNVSFSHARLARGIAWALHLCEVLSRLHQAK